MCGICGKLYFEGQGRVNEQFISRMCHVIGHRGPDEFGIHVEGSIGLGHRRLSIIDLSTGQQPMSNEQGDVWLVFNGEIYNFPELRRELEDCGYAFRTHSDTEVIIHLYERYGTACVKHLRGMFAFALWDKRSQRLFLARDRVGQKPLFYWATNTSIVFASEIKSILEDPSYERSMNLSAISHYLTYQYVPPPETAFLNICKLPPAHILVCEHDSVKIECYWELNYLPKIPIKEQEVLPELEALLEEAVRLRMISDVPLGAFLSGGIDSSLIVAIMSQYTEQPVKTFSIGFDEEEFNELPYARQVAERYCTEHHEFIVKPDATAVLPKLIRFFDEPFGDSSAIPTYYLSQITGQHVKVALNGDGGDESFAGYIRYLGYQLVQYYQKIPYRLRRSLLSPLLDALTGPLAQKYFSLGYDTLFRRMKYIDDLALQSKEHLYIRRLTIFHNEMKGELFTKDSRKAVGELNSLDYMSQYFETDHAEHFTDKMLYADVMTYLQGDLLVKIDRMTMAHGLEARSPFLDHRLMEFVAKIPARYKIQNRQLKFLLKRLGLSRLPQEILTRKKQGFGVPIGKWFQHELHDMLHDLLGTSSLAKDGILDGNVIRRILQEHQDGKINHHHRIWALLNLELWYRMFITHGS